MIRTGWKPVPQGQTMGMDGGCTGLAEPGSVTVRHAGDEVTGASWVQVRHETRAAVLLDRGSCLGVLLIV
jgi:hypothetical protein